MRRTTRGGRHEDQGLAARARSYLQGLPGSFPPLSSAETAEPLIDTILSKRVFSYAEKWDILLMVMAALAAITAGVVRWPTLSCISTA